MYCIESDIEGPKVKEADKDSKHVNNYRGGK
jgi:hypothetical protein